MTFHIITLFPEMFQGVFSQSILGRARKDKKITLNYINPRDFAHDKHKSVDDTPYGGGAGMIMKVDVLVEALESISSKRESDSHGLPPLESISSKRESDSHGLPPLESISSKRESDSHGLPPLESISATKDGLELSKEHPEFIEGRPANIRPKPYSILLSAGGKTYNQKSALRLSKMPELSIICGHYEGVDARVENYVDEIISIGDYVLTGGEIPAMAIVDSVTRLIPGVINPKSLETESFSLGTKYKVPGTNTEYPQYTRPEEFRGEKVPIVLLSGNHAQITKWRESKSRKK